MPTAALIVAILFFLVGLAGSVLPILPGTLLVWVGVLIHKLWMGDQSVSWQFVGIGAGIVALSYAADALFTWWGAKRFGASWKGALGAVVGGIVGAIFFTIWGMILGPIIGAVVVEYIDLRNHRQALRAGWGTFLGGLASMFVKLLLTVGLIGAFFMYLPDRPHSILPSEKHKETLPQH